MWFFHCGLNLRLALWFFLSLSWPLSREAAGGELPLAHPLSVGLLWEQLPLATPRALGGGPGLPAGRPGGARRHLPAAIQQPDADDGGYSHSSSMHCMREHTGIAQRLWANFMEPLKQQRLLSNKSLGN